MWKYAGPFLASVVLTTALTGAAFAQKGQAAPREAKKGTVTCPVMKAPVRDTSKAAFLSVNNEPIYVCCPSCTGEIKKQPAKYLSRLKDPVNGRSFAVSARTPKEEHQGALFLFSGADTHQTFRANPAKYVKR